ncbi:MAG: hypothetical protein ABIE36_01710 [Candidatus Diapherotrites archaeon]
MKKFLFLFIIFALVLGTGCKKKAEPVEALPPPPPPPEIEQTEFLLGLPNRTDVKNLKMGDSLIVTLNPEIINSPTASFATIGPFNPNLSTYYELNSVLKIGPLSTVWVGRDDSHMLIRNYEDFVEYYNSSEKFLLLDPIPAYIVRVGSKLYWVGQEGKFWKTY